MKPESIAKLGLLFAAIATAYAEWQKLGPFLDWLAFNARVLWAIDFLRHGVASIAFGTVVGLFVPYLLDKAPAWRALPTWRVHIWLGALTFASTFAVGVFLNDSRAGVVTSFGYAFGGPILTNALWRVLSRCKALRLRSMEPSVHEAQAVVDRALDVAKKASE